MKVLLKWRFQVQSLKKNQLILVEKKSTLKDMFYSISYSLSWNVSIFYIKVCKLSYVI